MNGITIAQVTSSIKNKLAECHKIAEQKGKPFTCHLRLLWAGGKGGHYDPKTKEIAINAALALKSPENFDHVVNVTVPHEAAHAIQMQHYPLVRRGNHIAHHDHNWAFIMNTFFHLPATRCHDMDTHGVKRTRAKAPRPFTYSCLCGKEFNLTMLIHNKIKMGAKYRCPRCRGELKPV
jgi:predicted SprT family Zn-dependent metalloprotease